MSESRGHVPNTSYPRESVRTLLGKMYEDWSIGGRDPSTPGLHAVLVYRLGFWERGLPKPVRLLSHPICMLLYWFVRNFYGIELPPTARIGRRFRIVHQSGIVVHFLTEIGDDCLLRHNVTLGAKGNATWNLAPKLGNRVEVGAGAVIIGRVSIGDDVRIGPNAVVMADVPAGSRVVVTPPVIYERDTSKKPS